MALAAQAVDSLCQDFVLFQGLATPGVARIEGAGSPRKIDERAGYGLSGATTIYIGTKLAKFNVRVSVWDASQIDIEWPPLALLLAPPPFGTPPRALSIYHPVLVTKPLNISSVLIEDVTAWEETDDGGWDCIIKCVEWRAPLPILAKATPPIPGSPEAAAQAQTATERSIQAQEEINAQLAVRPPGT